MAEGERDEPSSTTGMLARWEARDPGLAALKRSVRAALLVPAVFAVADFGVGNDQTTLFSVFGAFALLLFADFGGPPRVRLRSYAGLIAAGSLLITVGTLCSSRAAPAVVGMAVFGFVVLFAGGVSPQAAAGSTAALLTFVLPVAVPADPSAVGSRLAGWALASACCLPALMLLWPVRWHDPLRQKAARAALAIADLVDAHAAGRRDPQARKAADRALSDLRAQYEATPYRPAGAGPTDTALVRLVSRLEWVGENATVPGQGLDLLRGYDLVHRVHEEVACVLRLIARVVVQDRGDGEQTFLRLAAEVDRLHGLRQHLTTAAWQRLAADPDIPSGMVAHAGPGRRALPLLWELDPTYPIRILASATEMTAEMASESVRQDGGDRMARLVRTVRSMAVVARSKLTLESVWFRNSLRGAAAMAVAVGVVEVTDVQHGFWVVLGTLSVLRSNALGTGATAIRAIAGTVVGVALGAAVLGVLGRHLGLLWVVLPWAVLLAGVAPSVISFAAGQAGFTVAVVIVFNIIDPVGSKVGLIRIEDVAIGVVVSSVVGLLFWPRGAVAQLAAVLCEAYAGAVGWLVAEVRRFDGSPEPDEEERAGDRSAASWSRLDDAFRQFMSERGAKQVPLPTVTHLVTGCVRVRLVATTLAELPRSADRTSPPDHAMAAARSDVIAQLVGVEQWYEASALAVRTRRSDLPPLPPADDRLRAELVDAFDEALRSERHDRALVAMRLVWLREHLGDLRALQSELVEAAGRLTSRPARAPVPQPQRPVG